MTVTDTRPASADNGRAPRRAQSTPTRSGATRRDDLAAEQGYVDWAYGCLAKAVDRVATLRGTGAPKVGAAMELHKRRRLEAFGDAERELVIGRMDCADGDTWYVGKTHVDGDGDREIAVIDWRTPLAERFYQASRAAPLGVGRRRTFKMTGRQLLDMSDDQLIAGFVAPTATASVAPAPAATPRPALGRRALPDAPEPDAETVPAGGEVEEADPGIMLEVELRAGDLVLDELAQERSGVMRDVVATIQADQDRLVRAPLEGVLVIQGGPGTGKTVVGLHRAAYVLYKQRETALVNSVLVVGPNRAFLDYIRGVLPSLGEDRATQVTLAELSLMDVAPIDRARIQVRGSDLDAAAVLKGDRRMATVIRRAVWAKASPQEFTMPYGRFTLGFSRDRVGELIDAVRAEGGPYRSAPDRLRARLETALIAQCAQRLGLDVGDRAMAGEAQRISQTLRGQLAETRFHESVLPDMKPRVLIERLLSDADLLSAATRGVFGPQQRQALLRPRTRSGRFPWSDADLPLVAEAEHVIAGRSRSFGHVVVDEAQDLSPMQWRVLLRRSNRRSLTILGDLAQATGLHPQTGWTELLDTLGLTDVASVVPLTIGYRVPAPILDFACRLLPSAAPGLPAPSSIRTGDPPVLIRVARADLHGVLARIATEQRPGRTAIIVADTKIDEVRIALQAHGVGFGELSDGGLGLPVVLVTPQGAKGLEFDHVVVVEPRAIAGRTRRGLRLLFISLTRATKHLTVLHSDPLPKALTGERPPKADDYQSGATADLSDGHDKIVEEPAAPAGQRTDRPTSRAAEAEPVPSPGGPTFASTGLASRTSRPATPATVTPAAVARAAGDTAGPGQRLLRALDRLRRNSRR